MLIFHRRDNGEKTKKICPSWDLDALITCEGGSEGTLPSHRRDSPSGSVVRLRLNITLFPLHCPVYSTVYTPGCCTPTVQSKGESMQTKM